MKRVCILGDQLLTEHAALGRTQPGESRVLMIESKARGSTLPYHQLKLVLVYSAMRHFAAELRESGWVVDYRLINETPAFEAGLRHHLETHRPDALVLAEPNSFPETDAITKLGRKLRAPIELVPTRQFLLPRDEFRVWAGGRKRLLMENHYRRMRKEHDCLMQPNGEPVRRRVEFRSRESRDVRVVAESGAFPRTQRAAREVGRDHARGDRDGEARGPNNPGHASKFWLPVDEAGARKWLGCFIRERMPRFGVFEDVTAEGERRSLPLRALAHAQSRPSHTDGTRRGGDRGLRKRGGAAELRRRFCSGDHRLARVHHRRLLAPRTGIQNGERTRRRATAAGVALHRGDADELLHHVLRQNLELGWNHRIQWMMVLGNFMLIAGINPQEALRWFNERYVDAYDWVMAANVLGMSLYADGGYMATKPYAATSNYIRKMSNYCTGCRFDPDQKNRWTRARSTTCIGTSANTRSGSGRIRGCARSLAVG